MNICAQCGQAIPAAAAVYEGYARMTWSEKRILDIVAAAGEHGIVLERLLSRLYGADGGPLSRSYQTHISNLNRKLVGWRIKCDNWGGPKNRGVGGTYRLVPT
jgi:hypothetical protein